MRPDFHKVLIERPRSGMRGKRQPLPRLRVADWDGEEFAERPLPRPNRTKFFDDLLGPLRKWLRKQVNRPWDKVFAELVAGIDRRTTVGEHLIDHVKQMVTIQIHVDAEGRMIRPDWRWREVEGLYVHPRTGILRYRAPESRRQWRARQAALARQAADEMNVQRRLDDQTMLQRVKGIWYMLHLQPLSADELAVLRPRRGKLPLALRKLIDGRELIDDQWVQSRRQLSKAELRRHGLTNADGEDREQARSH